MKQKKYLSKENTNWFFMVIIFLHLIEELIYLKKQRVFKNKHRSLYNVFSKTKKVCYQLYLNNFYFQFILSFSP